MSRHQEDADLAANLNGLTEQQNPPSAVPIEQLWGKEGSQAHSREIQHAKEADHEGRVTENVLVVDPVFERDRIVVIDGFQLHGIIITEIIWHAIVFVILAAILNRCTICIDAVEFWVEEQVSQVID